MTRLEDFEDELCGLEYANLLKDFEFREADLERGLDFAGGPSKKLEGSVRFLARGWGRESAGSAARFREPWEEDRSFSELVILSFSDAWMFSSLPFRD